MRMKHLIGAVALVAISACANQSAGPAKREVKSQRTAAPAACVPERRTGSHMPQRACTTPQPAARKAQQAGASASGTAGAAP